MNTKNSPEPTGSHAETVRRACLPEVLFRPDIAVALQVPEESVETLILSGECGPYLRISGRLAVRRSAFLASLAARERHVPPSPDDEPDPGRRGR